MFKRDRSQPVEQIQAGHSQRGAAVVKSARAGFRFARCALMAVLAVVGSGLAGGCSDSLECKPAMPPGAVYQATLLNETATSDACHIVEMRAMAFPVTVGKTEPTVSRQDCSVTPAAAPPEQVSIDINVVSCVPSDTEMLGVYCQIQYRTGGCDGHMLFYFAAPPSAHVDWSAREINNVVFRIQDFSPNCFENQSNCLDEYAAKLVRIQ
jgi:hypothetical protein